MGRLLAAIKKEMLQFSRDWMLLALIGFIYTADVIMCTYWVYARKPTVIRIVRQHLAARKPDTEPHSNPTLY